MMTQSPAPLVVDARWTGSHGIARYSTEVLSRLSLNRLSLSSPLSPTSPFDVITPARWSLPPQSIVYSPGFNVGLTRAQQVVTIHDLIHLRDPSENSRLKKFYYDHLVKPAIIKSQCVFTVSETSAVDIRNWLATDSVSIVVTGCGVSPAFTPQGELDNRAEGKFLYVGSMKPHKNLTVVFDALSKDESLELVIVTSDVSLAEKQSVDWGVSERVLILSGLSDPQLAALYRAALAVVLPSTLEGFGLPAAETLACGTPVVYWRGCSSVHEIAAGLGVAVESSTEVGKWLAALKEIRTRGKQIVTPGQTWTKLYSWDSVAARVNTQLELLASRMVKS